MEETSATNPTPLIEENSKTEEDRGPSSKSQVRVELPRPASEPAVLLVDVTSAPPTPDQRRAASSALSPILPGPQGQMGPVSMRPGCELLRRNSRTSPSNAMFAPGLSVREAFGPRLCLLNVGYERAPEESPITSPKGMKTTSLEDSTGGLTGIYLPEDDEALPDTETLLFRDGRRRIDMVLVYEEEDLGVATLAEVSRQDRRKFFQDHLMKEGLELEVEGKQMSFDQQTCFVKVHVPWKVLTRYAEVMNMKMPIKRIIPTREGVKIATRDMEEETQDSGGRYRQAFNKFLKLFEYDHKLIAKDPSFYTATYRQDREEQFIIKDREHFFTATQRSQVVWQIMMRAKYDDSEKVGIRRLLNNGTYLAVFPLHEGRYDVNSPNGINLDRRLLYLEWARPSKWYKQQPLWLIKKYFGEKIGLYFAWLGFYTNMLIPASIVGLLCFSYGLLSMNSMDNIPSKEICDPSIGGKIIMCPLCDKVCDYQPLSSSCLFAKITYLFDNPATVFFAIFMSFWATMFLELWKRKQAVIVWEWDLQHVEEDEDPRPEFEASVKTFRINPVTMEREPYLPTWSKAWRFMATTSAVMFMVAVVLGAVLGTIIYRVSLVTVIYGAGKSSNGIFLKQHAKIFTTVTAAIINLVIIMILTKIYQRLATWLTNVENPRTQTEYEDSYTFKIFVFQFVNFYSSLIYIAFFKGRFFVHPGDASARNSAFTRLKIDVCDPAGCLSELCIQLSIIMVGKQLLNNFLEILYPKMYNWWSKRLHRSNTKNRNRKYTLWEEDYQLQDPGRLGLFEEYLEMVLQYGFVTLFVAAFPLAPLFALLNNIGEIRLDAYKMVTQLRRPLAERVEDIGAWYGILQGITYAAVVSNAFVIAYTSDFIPRMVYKYVYSPTGTLVGYIDYSLSEFNTTDYGQDMGADPTDTDPSTCQYRGYRNGPNDTNKYDLSPQYWHVFAARLAFVVIFEHIVFALTGVMAYAIPDVPGEVKTQIQREKLLEKEAKYEYGIRSGPNENYGEMLLAQRERGIQAAASAARSWWGRRLSRVSDSSSRQNGPRGSTATVWEVPG